ncbi:proline--tRNA ligase, partial [Thermoproteota archaeon]
MRFSKLFCPTLKETPKEAEIRSHQLMLRAGMIQKLASGIYSYLPLGYRVIQKMQTIIREELNETGAQEVHLPTIIPAELWLESGRWNDYGKELLRLKDRHNKEFCYGPTHEEVITDIVRHHIRSYKELPMTLYQIQTKFRDEIRPRFGVMRSREFCMKDAYSFNTSQECLDQTYKEMESAYHRIFERCGLRFKIVEADTGAIGGSASAEFMVTADTGEDLIIECNSCDYAANIETAETLDHGDYKPIKGSPSCSEIHTPGLGKVKSVADMLNTPPADFIKTLIYLINGQEDKPVAALVRGNHEVNEIKLKKVLNCQFVEL